MATRFDGSDDKEPALTHGFSFTVSHMADFLEEKKREIAARQKDLRPYVDEYNQLDEALRALGGVKASAAAPAAARATSPRRPPAPARAGGRRRGRPRGTGTRANQ